MLYLLSYEISKKFEGAKLDLFFIKANLPEIISNYHEEPAKRSQEVYLPASVCVYGEH